MIVQSGYNLDMTPEEDVADAQAYEPLEQEETKSQSTEQEQPVVV